MEIKKSKASDIRQVINSYLREIEKDATHRYSSWDNCRESFLRRKKDKFHSIELAFYLASWGMYRGSGGLLQKSHKIHQEATDLFFDTKYQSLICSEHNEVSISDLTLILDLKMALSNSYGKIRFVKGKTEKTINPTDTLITKIMLGLFCCMPAFDQYFIIGLKVEGITPTTFNKDSIRKIFQFAEYHETVLKECQSLILQSTGKHYPIMKIIDIYFWQMGYDLETEKQEKITLIDLQD